MNAMLMDTLIWGGVAAVLVAVMLFDLRLMKIPNWLSLALLALFAAMLLLQGVPDDIKWRVVTAVVVFCAGFAGFVLRTIGGGDVKILSALALFVPTSLLSEVLLLLSLSLMVCTTVVVTIRAVAGHPDSQWAFLRRRKMPMGLAIGAAGLAALSILAGA